MKELAQDVICEVLLKHGPQLGRDLINLSGGRLNNTVYVHLDMMEDAGRVRREPAFEEHGTIRYRYHLTDKGAAYMQARRSLKGAIGGPSLA